MKVQRIKYKSCGCIRQEDIHFVTGKRSYTNKFARYVAELSRIGTIKDVSLFLNISWDTTKDIQNRYLQRHYGNLNLSKLEYIGIDEFAVRKGHVYKTIVADLLTGQVVYVGDGKGADALKRFWKKVRKAKTVIKAVASTPYDDNPDVYRAGMFSIYTGLRKNDILALRWEDTHHDRVRIYIYIRFRIKKTDTLIQLPLSLPAIRVLGEPESDGKIFPMITESILVTHVSRWVSKAKNPQAHHLPLLQAHFCYAVAGQGC